MYNIVEQIESRYIAEFRNDAVRARYALIPRSLRQDILIRKLNCKPQGNRKTMIRWGSPEQKSLCFVSMSNITADSVELTVFPTPDPTSADAQWYTEAGLRGVVTDDGIMKKLVFYKKADGSRVRLRFKHLTWDEAARIMQPVVMWSRKNQNMMRAQPLANGVGLKEYEMIALILKTAGGSARLDDICAAYANLFGFALTPELADGVKVVLLQHSSDSDQFIGDKDVFRKADGDAWALR